MNSTALPPAALQQILTDVHNVQVSRYNMLALSILYIYDFVITFDREFEYIWKHPKSLLSVLFLLNRYLALIAAVFDSAIYLITTPILTNTVSKNWFNFQSGVAIVHLTIIEAILVIRVWAIYERNFKILVTLVVFGVCALVASSTIQGVALNLHPVNAEPAPNFFTCTTVLPRWFAAYWLPVMAFDGTLFTLMLWRGYQTFRKYDPVTLISGTSGRRLATVLVRDSIIYYLSINMVYIMICSMWYWADVSLVESSSPYGLFLPPIVISRLLLNIREEVYHPARQNTMELSTLRAASYDPSTSLGAPQSNSSRTVIASNYNLGTSSTNVSKWEEWGRNTN
ncbi:hypothetical protein DFJ43DRAFT_774316 [Lentinula guzmanii]|uniref:DUF6533 domain-containing protein n=1 Tax=Lentinula guzmanii TaxID=2804957 RepID=A0AA38JAG7_9AGAR|nr:hypothetical protein DFJ43DRAFT_774316 [Lentinula guzmanii]KAJ3795782.1 hypothetical protein GGU11DRAFT_207406 [Lentinula aff. detonsa]